LDIILRYTADVCLLMFMPFTTATGLVIVLDMELAKPRTGIITINGNLPVFMISMLYK